MGYADLRDFVKTLEKEGELRRIKAEVDPVLEITEIVQRAQAEPGPKGNPGGYQMVVYIGVAGPVKTPLIGPPRPL